MRCVPEEWSSRSVKGRTEPGLQAVWHSPSRRFFPAHFHPRFHRPIFPGGALYSGKSGIRPQSCSQEQNTNTRATQKALEGNRIVAGKCLTKPGNYRSNRSVKQPIPLTSQRRPCYPMASQGGPPSTGNRDRMRPTPVNTRNRSLWRLRFGHSRQKRTTGKAPGHKWPFLSALTRTSWTPKGVCRFRRRFVLFSKR
ncbi:MAG: hypothetical protein QOG25_580 [Acetobacteraceae bacterium]|nr:hypothetical protein [Acetobacteraceae bacterium]